MQTGSSTSPVGWVGPVSLSFTVACISSTLCNRQPSARDHTGRTGCFPADLVGFCLVQSQAAWGVDIRPGPGTELYRDCFQWWAHADQSRDGRPHNLGEHLGGWTALCKQQRYRPTSYRNADGVFIGSLCYTRLVSISCGI